MRQNGYYGMAMALAAVSLFSLSVEPYSHRKDEKRFALRVNDDTPVTDTTPESKRAKRRRLAMEKRK